MGVVASCGGNEGAPWTEKCEGPPSPRIHFHISAHPATSVGASASDDPPDDAKRAGRGYRRKGTRKRKKDKEGKGDSVDKGTNGINPTN